MVKEQHSALERRPARARVALPCPGDMIGSSDHVMIAAGQDTEVGGWMGSWRAGYQSDAAAGRRAILVQYRSPRRRLSVEARAERYGPSSANGDATGAARAREWLWWHKSGTSDVT